MSAYFSHGSFTKRQPHWLALFLCFVSWMMYLLCKVLPSSSALCKLAEDRQALERRKGVEM